MKFAVVKTSGRQFIVSEGSKFKVNRLSGETGEKIQLPAVLIVDGAKIEIGRPLVENRTVEAEIMNQAKDKKVMIFKMKRRKRYRRLKGHRQLITELTILKI